MTNEKRNELAWVAEGRKKGATHVLDVLDTFDYKNYPVYVMSDEDIRDVKEKYVSENMQRISGVYKIEYEEVE